MAFWVKRSTFLWLSGCTYFPTGYINTSWLVFLPTLYTDSGWWKKDVQKILGKMSLIKFSKGRCQKTLDDFADFSVFCQVGCFTYAFSYQFWWVFVVLEYSLLIVLVFFTFIIPGSRDIVPVVQTVQIDLQKFHFTESGKSLACILQNIANNFYKMQKGHVIAFYKIMQ